MATNEPKLKWEPPAIGNYKIKPIKGADPESPSDSQARAMAILGPVAYYNVLHRKQESNDTTKRKAFMQALVKIGGDKLNQPTTVTKKEQTLADIAKTHGEPDLLKLYQEAIQEERSSTAYIDAAFLKSVEVYEGGDFNKQQVVLIAGPSGVGKSKVRSELIQEITEGELDEGVNPAYIDKSTHHLVVFVDGGIEREISQIRDLMNKTALKLGYAGVEDLEERTADASSGDKLKKSIEEAADEVGLHLVIPTTDPSGSLKKYMKRDSTEVAYVSIIGNKQTVAQTSHNRAFAKIGDSFAPIDEMSKGPVPKEPGVVGGETYAALPESKKPGYALRVGPIDIGSFDYGTHKAKVGEEEYLKQQQVKEKHGARAPVVLHVEKDLVFITVLASTSSNENPIMEKMLMTRRQLEAWEKSGAKGTTKKEIQEQLKIIDPNSKLSEELITVVHGPQPAPVVMHTGNTEPNDDASTAERLQKNRDEAAALKTDPSFMPPPLKRQNTPLAPLSPGIAQHMPPPPKAAPLSPQAPPPPPPPKFSPK